MKEHFPDVEFDFVISRGGAQYLNDAALNDDLADIIIDASSWTQTSLSDDDYDINPKDYLYDFHGQILQTCFIGYILMDLPMKMVQ